MNTDFTTMCEPGADIRQVLGRLRKEHLDRRGLVLKDDECNAVIAWLLFLFATPVARAVYSHRVSALFDPRTCEVPLPPERVAVAMLEGPARLNPVELAYVLVSHRTINTIGDALTALAQKGMAPKWMQEEWKRIGRRYREAAQTPTTEVTPTEVVTNSPPKPAVLAARTTPPTPDCISKAQSPQPEQDDATLITRIAQGDRSALEAFHERWFPLFVSIAKRTIGNPSDGEDIAQETIVRVLMKAHTYKPGRPARGWLMTVLHNRVRDWIRRQTARPAVSLDRSYEVMEVVPASNGAEGELALVSRWQPLDPPGHEPTAEEHVIAREELVIARERSAAVQTALLKLPNEEREMIRLYYFQKLNLTEVARALENPVSTVWCRLHRARGRLGKLLQADWPSLFPSHEL
jgi:RNA polymerase sigma-70 factor, ECF subfamily